MTLERHEEAERLMVHGDHAIADGREQEGRAYYRAAAEAEAQVYTMVPLERPRTRGITALSVVHLFRHAGAEEEASYRAYEFLADRTLAEWARADLEDLVLDLRAEIAAREKGRTLGQDWVEWRLNGGSVGTGYAPADLVGRKIGLILGAATRIYESLVGVSLRRSGPSLQAQRDGFELLMTQPAAGSFRFKLRVSIPATQTVLFPDQELRAAAPPEERPSVAPEAVNLAIFRVLDTVARDDESALLELAPSAEYREAFLRLVKGLLPDGKSVETITVVHGGMREEQATTLTPALHEFVARQLEGFRPDRGFADRLVITDVLRAVHLNKGWIVLGKGSHEMTIHVGKSVLLEEIVEGLIDQPVRVTAHERVVQGGYIRFMLDEISEAQRGADIGIERVPGEGAPLRLWRHSGSPPFEAELPSGDPRLQQPRLLPPRKPKGVDD